MIALLWVINELDDTDRSVRFLRGARLVSGKDVARKTRNKSQQQVEIAGVPMSLACESNHLVSRSTDTGKSTVVCELLSFAIARGYRAVVIDPNRQVLNPFDMRGKGRSILSLTSCASPMMSSALPRASSPTAATPARSGGMVMPWKMSMSATAQQS